MPVPAGAEPFTYTGSMRAAVLLGHGFTGTPASMWPWGEPLGNTGCAIRGPLLPGHGITWQECNRIRWTDWYGCLREEFASLAETYDAVFICGLSMGGTPALRLARELDDAVAELALVNPSIPTSRTSAALLPLLPPMVPSIKGVAGDIAKPGVTALGYSRTRVRAAASLRDLRKLVRKSLHRVTQPLLLLHSVGDHIVEPVSSRIIAEGVHGARLTTAALHNSYHVATLDNDAPLIFRKSVEFVQSVRQVDAR